MRVIMMMYDSLNRHCLPNYGCDLVHAPNFRRLGERTVTFDNSYVGSLPCMPARRELHTGRLNFLHRGWSPVEPFDDSMPELLKTNGIYSHLSSDHQHYWEDGGATYHTRYQSWEIVRGQEGDPWKGDLEPRESDYTFGMPKSFKEPFMVANIRRQDAVNRDHIRRSGEFPQAQTVGNGLEFIEKNHGYDNWFLQIETFDPHEPFFSPEEYQALYSVEKEEKDWPPYGIATENPEFVAKVRRKYYALLSMCDDYLGRVLDAMDKYQMWEDTMLIVNTDHGYLLGEHLWWSKSIMPVYNEIAHTPLFIWDPRTGVRGERRDALVQTIDLAPTVLDFFGVPIPKDMQGKILTKVVKEDAPVREYALFGYFGAHVNVTDGRYLYMRGPVRDDNQPIYEYTLMPTDMRTRKGVNQLGQSMELAEPFGFTKGMKTMKLPFVTGQGGSQYRFGHMLFDLEKDPEQEHPIDDPEKEVELINAMLKLMRENEAPAEQYERVGLPAEGEMTLETLLAQREKEKAELYPQEWLVIAPEWDKDAVFAYRALLNMFQTVPAEEMHEKLRAVLTAEDSAHVTRQTILKLAEDLTPPEDREAVIYTIETMARVR